MRKTAILSIAMSVMTGLVLAGCAGLGGGPSAEDQILGALKDFKTGMETKNVDVLMKSISDDFSHYEFGDKDTLRIFIEDTMAQGDLDAAEVDVEEAEIAVDGDTAVVYPVDLVAVFGSATMEFEFKKEDDGAWRVVGMEVEGI